MHRDEGARSRSNHRLPLPTNIRILLAVQGNQLKKIVGLGTVGNKKIIGFWGVGVLAGGLGLRVSEAQRIVEGRTRTEQGHGMSQGLRRAERRSKASPSVGCGLAGGLRAPGLLPPLDLGGKRKGLGLRVL